MADNITRRLKIYVNGQEVDATITNLRKNLAKFRSASNRAVEGSPEWKKYNAEVSKLEGELKQATTAQKAFREDTKLTTAGVSDSQKELTKFTGSFSTLINGYKTGDLLQVQEGFNGVKSGIKGATTAAWKFIATPVGAIIAALAGIGFVAKEWLNYNAAVVEAIRTTTAITGLTDAAADKARINAETLQEVYGAGFEESLTTAKKLVTNFGISYDEAFATIEDGLTTGQIKNKEYFDSLSEYGVFFKSAGFSAQEFKDVISTGYDLGIYTDKLPDALKEADLALKEQTTATKESLVNAFGTAFSNELLAKVSSGEITTKEALQSIAEESEKANLSQQQFGQLTADVFKGAGEDVGGAKKIFEALTIAIDGTKKPLTESQQLLKDQATTTRELKEVSSALFATGDQGFGLLIDKAKLFGTKILVDILTTGVDVINWFIDLNNRSGAFSALVTLIGKTFTTTFSTIGIVVRNVVKGLGGLADIFEGIITLDFDKVTEGFSKAMATLPNIVKDTVQKAKDNFKDIKNAFNGNVQVERITLDSYVSNGNATPDNSNPTPNNPTLTDEQKEADTKLTKEDQAIINSKKKLKEWLDQWEADTKLQEEIDGLAEDEANKIKDEIALEEKYAKLEADAFGEKELLSRLEEAKKIELAAIDKKYADKKLKDKEEADKKYAEADKKTKEKLLKAEQTLQAAKTKALEFGVSALRNILGERSGVYKAMFIIEKSLAIKEILINTQKANAQITSNLAIANMKAVAASPLTGGLPFVGINTVIAGKETLSNNINAGVQVASIAGAAIQSLDSGGYTFDGPYSGGLDGIGGQLAMIHPEEYMLSKPIMQLPETPLVLEYLEAKAKGSKIPSLDKGGSISTNDSTTDSLPSETTSNGNLEYQLERLSNHLDKGLRIYYGYEDEESRQKIEDELNDIKQHAKS
ncbi:tail tape measure protein [Polaribacter phage Leef_1]|uniref:Tail tape measure protein n=1 Tax=Polaribacter phage Leef_1 TaxID=2745684 RepID=A0A8E5EC19_9CAUD|nr:tail tape measure protein [Polaribacter phage Leef_1]QQV91377.1 tail tape measure protein [Polaribacter phage Leef_1]